MEPDTDNTGAGKQNEYPNKITEPHALYHHEKHGGMRFFYLHRRGKMKITVNGKTEEINTCLILDFVKNKGLKPEAVVVEHNFHIVKMKEWGNIRLQENDNLELLSFVGGG